ncbi:hypothetical protein [Parasphingorhabdus sp.]|uniref:hypothetical protein n=1 Tax=Parasphingorhabdus sp. TaxID=2709688 RepID=UPI003A948AD9
MILNRLFSRGEDTPAPQPSSTIPAELVASIEAATVTWRSQDENGEPRCVVNIVSLGGFYFDGPGHAAERVARHWPELHEAACQRAGQLIAATIAKRNRDSYRPERKRSWVWDWME